MNHIQQYKEFLFEKQIWDQYEYIAGNGGSKLSPFFCPYIPDINKEVYYELNTERRLTATDELIKNMIHEKYNMTALDFHAKAIEGRVKEVQETAQVSKREVDHAVRAYLLGKYISFTDIDYSIKNMPLVEVW